MRRYRSDRDYDYEMADRFTDRPARARQFEHTSLQEVPYHPEAHGGLMDRIRGAFTGHGPKGYRRSDERIREDVCELLTAHGEIDASDVAVDVKDGEVTLEGTVEERFEKRLAEHLADGVRGVRDVHNRLRLQPRATSSSGTQIGLGDGAISRRAIESRH